MHFKGQTPWVSDATGVNGAPPRTEDKPCTPVRHSSAPDALQEDCSLPLQVLVRGAEADGQVAPTQSAFMLRAIAMHVTGADTRDPGAHDAQVTHTTARQSRAGVVLAPPSPRALSTPP